MSDAKPLGKASWWGKWHLPVNVRDHRKSKRAQRRREKQTWKRQNRDDH